MSFLNKLAERMAAVKDAAEQKFEEFKIEEPAREVRLEICKACPELIPVTNNCKKCGCFVHAKTWIRDATCPMGKW